ncbi:MAG TPA: PAS domain-containing protein [Burkholderiales bacterium]
MTGPNKPARVAIYQSDSNGRCVYVNSVLCELFEISEKDALGLGWLDRVHPDDRARVEAARPHAMSSIPVFHLDYRLRTSKGTIWVAAFSTALMDGGTFKGRIGIITDITDAKKHYPVEAADR